MDLNKNQHGQRPSTPPNYYGQQAPQNQYGLNQPNGQYGGQQPYYGSAYNQPYNQQQAYNMNPAYNQFGGISVAEQTSAVMRKVYVRMFIGLLVTAFTIIGVASSDTLMSLIFGNRIGYWVLAIAMLGMAIVIPSKAMSMSKGTVIGLFLLFSVLMGSMMAYLPYVYHLNEIFYTFLITAGTFGAMSVYGYFTKSDLTRVGSFLIMALIGLIITSIVNIFVASSALDWIISIVGVLIFVGLTAYDTQRVKRMAESNLSPDVADRLATIGALNLYLDFINLFLYILRIFGSRR